MSSPLAPSFAGLTFTKDERLSSLQFKNRLFEEGKSLQNKPVRLLFLAVAPDAFVFPVQILFLVPKRIFPRAHDRNRIRRMMREIYRLNKPTFYQSLLNHNKSYLLALSYNSRQIPTYKELEGKIILTLQRLVEQGNEQNSGKNSGGIH